MTEIPSGEETTTGEVSAEPREKCTTQFVPTVALRLRFLSSPIPTDQSIAETAFLTTGSPEKTATKSELRFGILTFIEYVRPVWLKRQTDDPFSIKIFFVKIFLLSILIFNQKFIHLRF
jgi:hypothetical protein